MIGHILDVGTTRYEPCCRLQLDVHRARVEGRIDDTLLLTEHFPVYTLGRTARQEHVGAGWSSGEVQGVPVHVTDRGGSVTYHGPGQLVVYPILRLRNYCAGPKAYVAMLEETLIRALAVFGISASRRAGTPGVWVDARKIGAIGVRISQGVTRHGFALNVVNDLAPFSAVVPCGLTGCEVTSMAKEVWSSVTVEQARQAVVQAFQEVFGMVLLAASAAEYGASVDGLACTAGPAQKGS